MPCRSRYQRGRRMPTILALLGAAVTFVPGAGVIGCQGYIYLRDGTWYSASLLKVATYDLEPRLAIAIQAPILGSWHDANAAFAENEDDSSMSATVYVEHVHAGLDLPPLTGAQRWLKYPGSWLGVHKAVAGSLDVLGLGFTLLMATLCFSLLAARSNRPLSETWEPAAYD